MVSQTELQGNSCAVQENKSTRIIKSVSYSQAEILQNILTLHIPTQRFDCDCTYSIGNFYKDTGVPVPKYKYDINVQAEGVICADCRQLPLADESIMSMIYDPPFLATKGPSLHSETNNNRIAKRFGVYATETELHQFYIDSLKEAYRVLASKGILVVKCQDKVSSGKQYMSHVFMINEAEKIGFYTKDLFVLLAKNRLAADWQVKNQQNARKYHSYFLVFEKSSKKVSFIKDTK